MPVERTVFISYRRATPFHARAVYQHLTQHGYDVFMDIERLDSGAFDQNLLREIERRAHFLIILTPTALDRCAIPGDWLRREIEHAIDHQRNIVPLMFDGFNFGSISSSLTGKLGTLSTYNGMRVPEDFFDEAMIRLRTRFLNTTVNVVLQPTMPLTPAPTRAASLTAEQYLERAKQHIEMKNWDFAIEDCNEAIRLNPRLEDAYYWRAWVRDEKRDYDSAIADYDQSLRLNPQNAFAYNNRGLSRESTGDYDGAIADFDQALRLNPRDAEIYYNRGNVRQTKGDLDGAITDYDQAVRLNPQDTNTYRNRGLAHHGNGNYNGAITDFDEAIRLNPQNVLAYALRGITHEAKGDLDWAIADFDEAIRLNPQNVDFYCKCGWVKEKKGDIRGAIVDYEQALLIDPNSQFVHQRLRLMLLAIKELRRSRGKS